MGIFGSAFMVLYHHQGLRQGPVVVFLLLKNDIINQQTQHLSLNISES